MYRVELTPADMHRRNAAERAIQTFKGHFISVLAAVPNSFPINQWHKLLPQTVLTLNLLRQSNVAPNISAWAYHHGSFDYNRMPIAPMGCEVRFHIKPARRKSFGEHSEDGFYLQTSKEHTGHMSSSSKRQEQNDCPTQHFSSIITSLSQQ